MGLLWLVLAVAALGFSGARSNPDTIDGRIIRGVDARARQFPFFAQMSIILVAFGETHERVWCGGSIISRRHVLTAAHCMPPGAGYLKDAIFYVYVGKTKIKKSQRPTGEQRIRVKHITNYEPNGFVEHDISILELERPIEFTETVKMIPLSDDDFDKDSYRSADCHMVGYGLIGHTRDPYFTATGFKNTHRLKTTRVNIEAPHVCNYFIKYTIYNSTLYGQHYICAATLEGRGSCRGDSGSPVVCGDRNGIFRQVGVVSFGMDAHCVFGVSGNSRVSYYRSWIANTLE